MPTDYNNLPGFADLNMTHYPAEVDTRINNEFLKINYDYTTGDVLEGNYIKAADVNALQDIVLAIQRTLGVLPQGEEHSTVAARLDSLPTSVLSEASINGMIDDKILAHHHNGTIATKISLASEVKDKLGKAYIDLDKTTGLTGLSIYVNPTSTMSIDTAINAKPGKADTAIITGDWTFSKRASTPTIIESDCWEWTNLDDVTDTAAFSGKCGRLAPARAAGFVAEKSFKLRYGLYALIVRMKAIAWGTTFVNIAVYGVKSGSDILYTSKAIGPGFDGSYQQIYIPFSHYATEANATNIRVCFIASGASRPNIDFDDIRILPINLAVWRK